MFVAPLGAEAIGGAALPLGGVDLGREGGPELVERGELLRDRRFESSEGRDFRADDGHGGNVRIWALSRKGANAPHSSAMGDRLVFVLPDDAGDDDVIAARAAGADEVIRRSELHSFRISAPDRAEDPKRVAGEAFLEGLTPTESRVLTELAHRPDTRSRLAARLGTSTSTLDNHLAAIKRKLLEHLESAGQAPHDGYLSMEAVIGWANRYI